MLKRMGRWIYTSLFCIIHVGLVVGTAFLAFTEIYILLTLRSFEISSVMKMFGFVGVATVLALNVGLFFSAWRVLYHRKIFPPRHRITNAFLVLWCCLILWFGDWMFVPDPLTLKIGLLFSDEQKIESYHSKADVLALAPFTQDGLLAFPNRLGIMLDRIIVNAPVRYASTDYVSTILKYSHQYDVDPILLFYLNYIESWYGKGPAGPMPFFTLMTPQTVRKFVQVHLPPFVVESPIRVYLASSKFYNYIFGDSFTAWQLHEFAQKFTLDASIPPYASNIFSDALLVMKEYPDEFVDLQTDRDGVSIALNHSFAKIENDTLRKPYEDPYVNKPDGNEYYESYRGDLQIFARAVFYKMMFDFDFATKVQALRERYDERVLRETIGEEGWGRISNEQKQSMLVMMRDMFTPNVGRLGDNLYTLCEINCAPTTFVATEAKRDLHLIESSSRIWRPKGSKLYAGDNYRLRVFSEVWQAFYGVALPGVYPTDTVSEALRIVEYNRG